MRLNKCQQNLNRHKKSDLGRQFTNSKCAKLHMFEFSGLTSHNDSDPALKDPKNCTAKKRALKCRNGFSFVM